MPRVGRRAHQALEHEPSRRRARSLAVAASLLLGAASASRARADDAAAPKASSPSAATAASAAAPTDADDDRHEKPSAAPIAIVGPVLTTPTTSTPEPMRKVVASDAIAARARDVAAAIKDAATDLGLEVDLTAQLPDDGVRDLDLLKRASAGAGVWVFSPRLESLGKDSFELRIVAVPPKSATLLVRVEKVDGAHATLRAVVMMRDFVQMKLGNAPVATTAEDAAPRPEEEASRSRGRPILAASTTLFGLYAAFSIHRSSGSDDPRLLYPLLALGSGIGLGASLLAADEWNVTPGAAWTVAGGTWWGVAAGLNIAAGRNIQPSTDRYGWGLAGGLIGTTFAVTSLALTRYDDGDAALTHSGAALGMFTGGVIEGIYCGNVAGCADHGGSPSTGLGYGAGAGLLLGGALAAFVDTSAQRVLFVDLGAGLGALGGASLGSPLIFKDKTEPKTRAFLAAVLAGTAIGGGLSLFLTRDRGASTSTASASRGTWVRPTGGIVGTSQHPLTGAPLPIFGAGLVGSF